MARYFFSGKRESSAKYSRLVSGVANLIQGESIASVFSINEQQKLGDGSCFVLGKNLPQLFRHRLDGGLAAAHSAGVPENNVGFLLPGRIVILTTTPPISSPPLAPPT